MRKFSNIVAECLAIAVLYKIMLMPKGEVALVPHLSMFLEWGIIFIIIFLLFIKITSNIARIALSGIAIISFFVYELYPLSPQSVYFLTAIMFIYFLLAFVFRRNRETTG